MFHRTVDPIQCRMPAVALSDDGAPGEIMVMPGGVHQIRATQGDKGVAVTVQVDRITAATLQKTFEAHQAAGKQKPFFDFDHDKNAASAWPLAFYWKDAPAPGVYAKVEWSRAGAAAIDGREYRAFSPSFFVDDEAAKPARVTGAPLNMGGLVNDPAFREIAPLWAKTGPSHEPLTHQHYMTTELEATQAENRELREALQARRKADAKAAVDAAIRRGVIPPKNEAIQARWAVRIEANPEDAELLAAMPGHNPSVPITRPGNVELSILREDIANVLKGYLSAKTPSDKGLIYRQEIDARLNKGEIIPFGALQDRLPLDAQNSLGTLVGNIISQRTLALVYSRRPMLKAVFTDFSDAGACLNQNVYTRTIGMPTVQDFPAGAATDRSDTDYPVTLDQAKQVRFTLTALEANATGRDMIAEHAEPMAVALGSYLVDAVAALVTDDFTEETVLGSAQVDFTTLSAIAKAMNAIGVPDMGRRAWVNSDVAESLTNDELVMENFDNENESAYGHWRNIKGFADIWEYPALPANNVNLTGFFCHASAVLLVARICTNPQGLLGASYPGRLMTVTDPVSGLSVLSNQWVDAESLALNDRLIVLFGVDRGNLNCGHKLVSA
ncbi:MAG: phage protease [Verrucomicrobiia bacterium]